METISLSKDMKEGIKVLVSGGYYPTESELLRDAFRTLLNTKTELKVSLAVELYLKGRISLMRAAEFAGMTTVEFKDVLANRGITRETEGKPVEKMDKKIKQILRV